MSIHASKVEYQESKPWNARENHMIGFILWVALGIGMSLPALSRAQVVINEAMASNANSFADPQGEFDDWIELYNADDTAVDVGGMYLTDDPELPAMWQIPSDYPGATVIDPGSYLLIWMDGDTADYQVIGQPGVRSSGPPASGFHAGFRLNAGGDEIHLFDVDGVTRIDSLAFGEQTPDLSYGRYPNGGDTLRFFGEPTPGGPNGEGYEDEVAPLRFSHERGFYTGDVTRLGGMPGFDLTIVTATPDARIVYTLDGTRPDEIEGHRVPPGRDYTGPIHIDKTVCVRAMAFKPGCKPTKIYTRTFIFDSRQGAKPLPIISLVGDAGDTFYEPNGVMAIVGGTYVGGTWSATGPSSYNNILNRDLERPVSAEWFVPGQDEEFQVDCGLRVHGSPYTRPRYTRQSGLWAGTGKISLRLYFRGEYGLSWLPHSIFPLSQAGQFESIILRAGHNDISNPFIKDELIRRLHRDMGQVACMGTFANLYINGEYKGFYNPTEHVKEESCQQWFNSDKPWDVMTMNGVRDGDSRSWDAMISYARTHNMSNPAYYAELCKKLDVVCFIDYLIVRLWANDWDWPQNNWSAACERSETGQWKFFVWDAEGTFESGQLSADRFPELNNQSSGNSYLYRALKANPDFRLLFADRVYEHFFNGGALTQQNVTRRFSEMRSELLSVIPNMNAYIIDGWTPNRHSIFLGACTREGVYTFAGPDFTVNGASRYGGSINAGESLRIASSIPGAPVFYTLDGSDPAGADLPQAPIVTTLVAPDAPKRVLVPTGPDAGNWRSLLEFDDSPWLLSPGAPGGVGYERSTGYERYISVDVGGRMYNINGSCYLRIPFQFNGNRDAIEAMTLKVQYDDGFIAYLNGTEVARRNFNGQPAWNSVASTTHNDSEAILFESIDLSAHRSQLRQGGNLLAIQGMNSPLASSDFLIGVELAVSQPPVSDNKPGAQVYTGPIALTKSTVVKARVQNGNTWSALAEAVFAVGPVKESLRISEILYHPASEISDLQSQISETEYVELTNIDDEAINLNFARFTKGIEFTFPDVELSPGAFCLVVKDREAFEARYGPGLPIVGQYAGSLSNSGEPIELQDAVGAVIHNLEYRDDWFDITDGSGFSLTVNDPAGTPVNFWGNRSTWRPSAASGGSPGLDDSGGVPALGTVVINELLANSAGVGPDWIELHNTTDQAVNIGGWFLSDDGDDLTRYRIADGTVLPPDGFLVLDENEHFGNSGDPGCRKPFALSGTGETVYLHSGDPEGLTGYCEQCEFGSSEPGSTFGRYESAAIGESLVLLTEPTPGGPNADPRVGPIVINEILYHFDGATEIEYVELFNITDSNVTLYDSDRGAPWRFTDGPQEPGIELLFPGDPPITLGPQEYLLLVKDVSLFQSRFMVPASVRILPWGLGKLSDVGQTIQLSRPGDLDNEGIRSWIAVDRIRYSDGLRHEDFPAGVDLWPVEGDGRGLALTRTVSQQFGNDPLNWRALTPSPGTTRPRGTR